MRWQKDCPSQSHPKCLALVQTHLVRLFWEYCIDMYALKPGREQAMLRTGRGSQDTKHMFNCAMLDNPSTTTWKYHPCLFHHYLAVSFLFHPLPLSLPLCHFDEEQTHSAKHSYLMLSLRRWHPETQCEGNRLSIVTVCWIHLKHGACKFTLCSL